MRTASYRLSDLQKFTIPLGFVGENEHCQIIFLADEAYAEYPHAAVSLTVRPPYGEPYPAVVTRDGNNVLWTIKDSDLTRSGQGEIQLSFTTGEVVAKTYVGKTKVCRSIVPTGEVPDPLTDFLTEAGAALTAIPETIAHEFEAIQAVAQTLEPGSQATAHFNGETKQLEIGVPEGQTGATGNGIASIEKTGTSGLVDTYTITFTNGNSTTFTVKNGKGIVSIAKTGSSGNVDTYTITFNDGDTTTFTVTNANIDDTAGDGDTDKTWSADKLLNGLNQKQDKLKVTSLTQTPVASGQVVDSVGIPVYVDDVTDYSAYGITDTGWYSFVRITAKEGVAVSAQTTVTGADGYIATIGADHVDVAVRFGVAAQSKTVTIAWGSNYTESFVFRATDLAVRNLDYRSTFYIYDIADFAEWTWALTTDETFQDGVNYYTESGGEYTLATVTVGDAIPADTYYVHSKLTFSGMIRNVTYRFNEMVDCPIEIVLPEVPDDGYGAWFEIQMQYSKQVSTTLLPTDPTVVIGTASTQAQTAGINVIDLQYSGINEVKMWTLLNTHSNLPTTTSGEA